MTGGREPSVTWGRYGPIPALEVLGWGLRFREVSNTTGGYGFIPGS